MLISLYKIWYPKHNNILCRITVKNNVLKTLRDLKILYTFEILLLNMKTVLADSS